MDGEFIKEGTTAGIALAVLFYWPAFTGRPKIGLLSNSTKLFQ